MRLFEQNRDRSDHITSPCYAAGRKKEREHTEFYQEANIVLFYFIGLIILAKTCINQFVHFILSLWKFKQILSLYMRQKILTRFENTFKYTFVGYTFTQVKCGP